MQFGLQDAGRYSEMSALVMGFLKDETLVRTSFY